MAIFDLTLQVSSFQVNESSIGVPTSLNDLVENLHPIPSIYSILIVRLLGKGGQLLLQEDSLHLVLLSLSLLA